MKQQYLSTAPSWKSEEELFYSISYRKSWSVLISQTNQPFGTQLAGGSDAEQRGHTSSPILYLLVLPGLQVTFQAIKHNPSIICSKNIILLGCHMARLYFK